MKSKPDLAKNFKHFLFVLQNQMIPKVHTDQSFDDPATLHSILICVDYFRKMITNRFSIIMWEMSVVSGTCWQICKQMN